VDAKMKNGTDEITGILKLLSVRTRIKILELLKKGDLCVNALSAGLDVTQGAVSQHLRLIREAGIIKAEKRGCYVHYSLNGKILAKCFKEIEKFFSPETKFPEKRKCMRHEEKAGRFRVKKEQTDGCRR